MKAQVAFCLCYVIICSRGEDALNLYHLGLHTITLAHTPRIISGTPAVAGQFPWQVYLAIKNEEGGIFSCGGSLIHVNWVLTASHCVHGVSSIKVRLGSLSRTSGGQEIDVKKFFSHPKFETENFSNDIALLRLTQPAKLSDRIKVIKLAPYAMSAALLASSKPTSLVVSGWGRTNENPDSTSPVLMYAKVRTITLAECKKTYKDVPLTTMQVCTMGSPLQAPCQGDSGGPLVVPGTQPLLVGVVSFGYDAQCTSGLYPDVYVIAAGYRTWLQSTTKLRF